jgi:hypothetical protein
MSGTIICVWAAAEHRLDAFVAALSALTYARDYCRFQRDTLRLGHSALGCTVAEAISIAELLYGAGAAIEAFVDAMLNTRRVVPVAVKVFDDAYARAFQDYEPFIADVYVSLPLDETEDLLSRICASPHVLTCSSSISRTWPAPAEASATYHADGNVARDLALTWLHLRDRHRVRDVAGLSVDALRARVEAAPPGTSVGVATSLAAWYRHDEAGWGDARTGRPWLPGDAILTREQVLAALSTRMLLEALEAAAVPDDDRAPFRVRRLANGGVLLATHPDRILWPLWADALFLLGITC